MSYRNLSRFAICLIAFYLPMQLHAQEAKAPVSTSVYKIDYVFSELQNDKKVNARSYSVLVRSRNRGSIRLGNRFPVATSDKDGGTQFQYLDIGVSIDSRVEDSDLADGSSTVDLFTNVDISSIAPEQPAENRTGSPIVRQIKFQNENIVPLGKLVLLSSGDEVDGTRRLQVEATVTKVR